MKTITRASIALCLFLTIAFLTAGTVAAVAPTADLTYSERLNASQYIMDFHDTSTGNPTAWTWYFGDDTISHAQNPSHEYSEPGWYFVTLWASNSDGRSFMIKEVPVYV